MYATKHHRYALLKFIYNMQKDADSITTLRISGLRIGLTSDRLQKST